MSDLIKTFERDGFEVRIYHREDPEDSTAYLGTFTQDPTKFPAWDRCKKRVLWNLADYSHHRAKRDAWDDRAWRYVHDFQDTGGATRAEAEQYIRQNVARLIDYGAGWAFIGVEARVYRAGVELGRAAVWGVESDADAAYLDSIAEDEAGEALAEATAKLAELRATASDEPCHNCPDGRLDASGKCGTCGKTHTLSEPTS